MRKKLLIVMLVSALVITGLAGCGSDDKEKDKSYTVGYLNSSGLAQNPYAAGFQAKMTALGYVEGDNITYITETPDSPDNIGAAAQKLVDAKVDLIFAFGRVETLAAMALTTNIPILFGPSYRPVEAGLITSIQSPGGNVTGIYIPDTAQLRLQLLLEIDPAIKVVAFPYSSADTLSTAMLASLQDIAPKLNCEILPYELSSVDDALAMFENLPEDVDAVFVGVDRYSISVLTTWYEQLITYPMPFSISSGQLTNPTVLMGHGLQTEASGEQAAILADKILKGTAIKDLPAEQVEIYLAVSLVAADMLGIEIPDTILRQAADIVRVTPAAENTDTTGDN